MKHLFWAITLICCTTAEAQEWERQNIAEYDSFDGLAYIFSQENDTTYLINFWATWCGPCVKELPFIEALHDEGDKLENPLKIILVSLDFPKQIDSKLIPFLNKNHIRSEVILLTDSKTNDWIDRVDPSWSGSIPITLIYNNNGRKFYEKEFHSVDELIQAIP